MSCQTKVRCGKNVQKVGHYCDRAPEKDCQRALDLGACIHILYILYMGEVVTIEGSQRMKHLFYIYIGGGGWL